MDSFDFAVEDISHYIRQVDIELKKFLPENISGVSRLLQARGKRLRPGLVIAAAHHNGKEIDDRVLHAATSVELIHIASLVHDDIMDEAELRWGVPTISSQEGPEMALLAGDYLLAKGCALASSVEQEAGIILAEAVMQLSEGQAVELKDRANPDRTVQSLHKAIKGKTSSLFIAALKLGSLVAGYGPNQMEILARFGEDLGIAFQYKDDVADFIQPAEKSGKPMGGDIREGNYTLPVILSLHGPNGQTLRTVLNQNLATSEVLAILHSDGSIERTLQEADIYKQKALESLESFENNQFAQALREFTKVI